MHVALLAASVLVLPIIPAAAWKPLGTEEPVSLILGLLTVTIGLPYFLLATTSPLLQAWFAERYPERDPYRLFALSNFASLAALVAYPFAIEPWVATRVQALAWSAAYAVFALLCAAGSAAVAMVSLFGDGDVEFAKHSQLAPNFALAPAGLVITGLVRRMLATRGAA